MAENSADKRSAGHAEAEGGLVEDDGDGAPTGGHGDDHGERGGDEQGVAQSPAGAEADELTDAAGGAGQACEDDDEGEAGEQGLLAADPAGDRAGDEHHHGGHREVAGEQQGDLGRAGVEVLGDGREDGVDQADAHEGEHTRQGGGPDGDRLVQHGLLL